MDDKQMIMAAQEPEWVEAASEKIQPAILKAFQNSGEAGKAVKNFLHGKWLGHPLHPILTDIPIGAYTVTAALDIAELAGNKKLTKGADASLAIGLAGALGAAVTGITDWTATSGQSRRTGLVHAALNVSATLLNVVSLSLRKNKSSRLAGIGCSFAAYALTTAGAYLGGHLVYGQKIGTDHTAEGSAYPLEFTDVMKLADLSEQKLTCAMAAGVSVLLYREGADVYAIENTCSHMGGPLHEGKLIGNDCVECPWHASVFSLKTGGVVEGPATAPQTRFETRVFEGNVQVRLHPKETLKINEARN